MIDIRSGTAVLTQCEKCETFVLCIHRDSSCIAAPRSAFVSPNAPTPELRVIFSRIEPGTLWDCKSESHN
jgi:hypothetical protein